MELKQPFQKFIFILWELILGLFLLLVTLMVLVKIPFIQTKLVQKATEEISESIHAKVQVDRVSIDFFTKLSIENILLADNRHDTIVYVKSLKNQYSILLDPLFSIKNKKIAIDGIRINLANTRKDSTLNIAKLFKSKDNNATVRNSQVKEKDTISKKKSFNLYFSNIKLTDVKLCIDNKYSYIKYIGSASEIELKSKKIEIHDRIFNLEELHLVEPFFELHEFKNNIPSKVHLDKEYLNIPFLINCNNLLLEDGRFHHINENNPSKSSNHRIAFNDLGIQKIFIDADHIKIRKGSIVANMNHLSCQDKSGLGIKKLSAKVNFSSNHMVAQNLYFKSNRSELIGSLTFKYQSMIDYLHFAKTVNVVAKIKQGTFSVDDIVYFAPDVQFMSHNVVHFNSDFSGKMNDLKLSNFSGKINKEINVQGTIVIKNLFESSKFNIMANIKSLVADKNNINYFLPIANLPNNFEKFGSMRYTGKYEGDFKKFKVDGILETQLGNVQSLNSSFDFTSVQNPNYRGNYKLTRFELGKVLEIDNLDKVDANFTLIGTGIKQENFNSTIDGSILSIRYNQYDYKNVNFNGAIKNKIFSGKVSVNDPNVKLESKGEFYLSKSNPKYDATLNLSFANLKPLNFLNKDYKIQSVLHADMIGKNIDELNGTIFIDNLKIIHNTTKKMYPFSNIRIRSSQINLNRKIEINSDEINGHIGGKYKLSEIPNIVKTFFVNNLKLQPEKNFSKKDYSFFDFRLSVDNIDRFATLIDPDLKNADSTYIKGSYDGLLNRFEFVSEINNLEYGHFIIPKIKFSNSTNELEFASRLYMDTVFYNNKVALYNLTLQGDQSNGGMLYSLKMLNKEDPNYINLNVSASRVLDDIKLHILPFTKIQEDKWKIDERNQIVLNLASKKLNIKNMSFTRKNEIINFSTPLWADDELELIVENLKIKDFIQMILPNITSYNGMLSGKFNLLNIFTNPSPMVNFKIQNASIDQYKVGEIIVNSNFDSKLQKLNANIAIDGDVTKLNASGNYFLDPAIDSLNFGINIQHCNPSILNKYISNLMYNSYGALHGEFNLLGSSSKPYITGQLSIDTFSTTVAVTNAPYTIAKQHVELRKSEFVFKDVEIKDPYGNKGLINGNIYHNYLNDFSLDVIAKSNNILCLNTTTNNNPNFYGTVYAKASAHFYGEIGDRITIQAFGENTKNSSIVIQFASSKEVDRYNFYEFVDKQSRDQIIEKQNKINVSKSVNLDFHFLINDDCKLTIIQNPELEDKIQCNGFGDLAIKMNPEIDLDIKGSYEIKTGSYLFTFQKFVRRTFYLEPKGSIFFIGDPKLSYVNASATFKARASAQELVTAYYGSNPSADIATAAKTPVVAKVKLNLKDRLMNPKISYEIDIEENNPTVKNAYDQIKSSFSNENELNRQVFGLLAFQRFFAPTNTGFEKVGVQTSDLTNTMTDIVTSKVSGVLTEFLSNTVTDLNFDLRYRTYNLLDNSTLGSSAMNYNTRNELKLALSKKISNNWVVNAGTNVDFGQRTNSGNNTTFGGDLDVEYLIPPKGEFLISMYSRIYRDPLNSKAVNRSGLGFVFRKDFDHLMDLFRRKKKNIFNRLEK